MNKHKRIARWDNIKFFMIASVVLGHTIYHFTGSSDLAKSLYLFIYTYHMPVFIFVAGLFSKHAIEEKRFETVFEYLLIYIVMKFLETIGTYMVSKRIKFHFFWEDGPAWFAFAIAAFLVAAMLLKDYDKKYVMVAILLIGCLAGLDNHLGDHYASMRICVFFPVFMAGYYIDPSVFELKGIQTSVRWIIKICSVLFLLCLLFLCVTKGKALYPMLKLLKGKYNYMEMKMGIWGVLYRLLCYGFWVLMIAAVIFFVTEKERLYTWLGKRTMSVFIWHNLMIVIVLQVLKMKPYLKVNVPHYYLLAAICIAMIITILTSYLPQIRVASKMSHKEKKNIN